MLDVFNCFTYDETTPATLAQAYTDTALSDNVIDLDAAGMEIAVGKKTVYLKILVTVAFGGAAEGVYLTLENASNAGISTDVVDVWMSGLLNVSQLASGTMIQIALPVGVYAQQYLGFRLTKHTNTPTGSLIVWLDDIPESGVTLLDMDNTN